MVGLRIVADPVNAGAFSLAGGVESSVSGPYLAVQLLGKGEIGSIIS